MTDNAEQSGEGNSQKCLPPPESQFSIADVTVNTGKIPDHKLAEINGNKSKSERKATEDYEKAKRKAEATKSDVESKHDLARKQYDSDKELLKIRIENAITDLEPNYQQCLVDSSSGEPKRPHEQAICVADLRLKVLEKAVEFQTEMQPLDQTWTTAEADWVKAQQVDDSAICVAKAELTKAIQSAQVIGTRALVRS